VSDDKTGVTPQQKRRDATALRLRAAMARLLAQKGGTKLSVAALAREAGVGRNAIYVNHRYVIAELLQTASHEIDATVAGRAPWGGVGAVGKRPAAAPPIAGVGGPLIHSGAVIVVLR
jgi:hypothetical protein